MSPKTFINCGRRKPHKASCWGEDVDPMKQQLWVENWISRPECFNPEPQICHSVAAATSPPQGYLGGTHCVRAETRILLETMPKSLFTLKQSDREINGALHPSHCITEQ